MGWIDPRYEAARRKYWTRHDAQRFAAPNPDERKTFAARRIELRRAEEEAAQAAEWEAFGRELAEVRREWNEIKREIAARQQEHKYEGQPRTEIGRYSFGKRNSPRISTNTGPNRRVSIALAFTCEEQYRRDVEICRMSRSRACYEQAALRYGNCLVGKQIPPLNF